MVIILAPLEMRISATLLAALRKLRLNTDKAYIISPIYFTLYKQKGIDQSVNRTTC